MKSNDLKHLQVKMDSLKSEIKELNKAKTSLFNEISKKNKLLNSLASKISGLTKKDIVVSEHAIVRCFERMYGFDIRAVEEMLLKDSRAKINALGDGTYPIEGGKIIVKGRVIVSVVG